MGDEDKTSSTEDEAEDEWDKNEFTQSQIEALNKLESSELNTSTTTTMATVKSEPLSDDDIMFVGHFISGTYEGLRAVKDSIKQENISPEMLMQYNKSAVGDQKIVPIQEVLDNKYDFRQVYTDNELQELLNGPHRHRYKKNIEMVEKLKKSIVDENAVQKRNKKVEAAKVSESEAATRFECLEQERHEAQHLEQEKLEVQHCGQEKLEVQHCEQEKLEAQCHEQEKLEAQHHEQEKREAMQHLEQEELEAQCCEQEKVEVAQCLVQEKLEVHCCGRKH